MAFSQESNQHFKIPMLEKLRYLIQRKSPMQENKDNYQGLMRRAVYTVSDLFIKQYSLRMRRSLSSLASPDNITPQGSNLLSESLTKDSNRLKKLWQEAANDFKPFADEIRNLGRVITKADETIEARFKADSEQVKNRLSHIVSKPAKALLADLLFFRVTNKPEKVYYPKDYFQEASRLALEVGSQKGILEDIVTNISLNEVVEMILEKKIPLN